MNPKSINNLKSALSKSDVYEKLDKSLDANPDSNYDILAIVIANSKVKHIPKKTKKFNKKKNFHQKWMTDELLQLVIRKNAIYKEWKATIDKQEYLIKKNKILGHSTIYFKKKTKNIT